MKGRTVKLKDAHRGNGTASFCSILWDHSGGLLVTASASDSTVLVHDVGQPSKPAKAFRHHRDGVTAVALNPNCDSLASGSIDHCVKLFSFPDGEFQSNFTRFTLPIRALAFNKSGSLLAAAGDDDGIKLIATVDSSISRVLKGHNGSVTGLSFDPKNEFLASIDGFGTVIYWELSSGKPVHTLKSVAPYCDSDASLVNFLSWSPDGEILAVPGTKNDIVMYDRDTAEKLFTMKGDHDKPVCFLSWSANGKYMATSGLDKQVLIWDVDQRQDIDRQKFDDRISFLSWKPNSNALALIDIMGRFGVWETPVPSCMRSPSDGVIDLQSRNVNSLLFFDVNDKKTTYSGSLDEIMEESHGESIPVSRKRLKKNSALDKSDEDSDGEDGLLKQIELRKKSAKTKEHGRLRDETEEYESPIRMARPKLQEAFQPCSTPVQAGKRRFLSYNLLGSITTIENAGNSHIEAWRLPFHILQLLQWMVIYQGFTMGDNWLSSSFLVKLCTQMPNTISSPYRAFFSIASNRVFSIWVEGRLNVKSCSLGTAWLYKETQVRYRNLFNFLMFQRHILSLEGPVVTAAGFRNKLAVVTHASDCFPSGDQVLEVNVYNICDRTKPLRCHVPISPGSSLSWFGFSEEGDLCTYDSQGVLRLLTNQYGNSWFPVFSASKAKKSEDENYWIVGLNENKLFCVVCKSPNSYPLVMPKPVLMLLDLKFPLACSDLGADDLENEFLIRNLHLSKIQEKIEENAAAGLHTDMLDDEAFDMEAAIDRCILRLISSCCNGDKLVRATELARLLSMEKSIKGSIKLVTALKLPNLAERFNDILEMKLDFGERIPGIPQSRHVFPLTRNCRPAVRPPLPSPLAAFPTAAYSRPSFLHVGLGRRLSDAYRFALRQVSAPVLYADKPVVSVNAQTSNNNDTIEREEISKGGNEKNTNNISKDHDRSEEKTNKPPEKKFSKKVTGSTTKEEGNHLHCAEPPVIEKCSQRPTNPFAKSSSKLDKSSPSLLDSIKKMKSNTKIYSILLHGIKASQSAYAVCPFLTAWPPAVCCIRRSTRLPASLAVCRLRIPSRLLGGLLSLLRRFQGVLLPTVVVGFPPAFIALTDGPHRQTFSRSALLDAGCHPTRAVWLRGLLLPKPSRNLPYPPRSAILFAAVWCGLLPCSCNRG
ncbi:hypothetical protein KSP40_PGU006198 [Platanthera guangdongensis]|uniref:WD repeat and HMG-box DNA-binding protein 1 n=1 Tax=Platanthera guangdongensis TaxID=2320717 RepID=A0ABR2MEY8_9ASPA